MKIVMNFVSVMIMSLIALPMTSFAQGDAVAGEKTFKKKCRICHTYTKGDKAKIGPNLYGVAGRKAGQFEGYKYSKGLNAADLTWDDVTLDAYLLKPKAIIKKGKMIFAGFKKEKDRNNVIAYLKTLKD